MKSENPWDYLRGGDVEKGLSALRDRHKRNPSGAHIMELGVAYLWIGDYLGAEQHFQHAIKTHPTPGDSDYGMAGTARWCVSDPAAAVKHWQGGLSAQYAISGLGINIPLLLFLASILRPGVYRRQDAKEILLERIQDPRATDWPGPLALFILDKIDNASLGAAWVWGVGSERGILPDRKWLSEFYKGVLGLACGKLSLTGFRQLMMQMADTSQPEWSEEDEFLSLLWNAEFFIARYEGSLTEGTRGKQGRNGNGALSQR